MNIAKAISEKNWRSQWPSEIHESPDSASLPDVPWKGQVSRYRRIFQAMLGVGNAHCGVSEIHDLLDRMNQWSDRHASHFSWPPSVEGWNRAVWATMSEPQGKEDMAWLWAGYGPSLQLALSDRPSPHAWAVSLLRGLPESEPDIAKGASSPGVVDSSKPSQAPPAAPVKRSAVAPKEREISPDVMETRGWLLSQLVAIGNSQDPEGILQERFDQAIKERIDIEGRPGPRMHAGWIEYRLIPAVAGLDANMINLLVDFWPQKHSRPLIDPVKTLSAPRFWALIEDAPDKDARSAYVDRFLPTVIDTSEWSSSMRYQLGTAMFEWTAKRPKAFAERLGLWRAWGGKMDDAATPASSDGSVFNKAFQPSETMESWIAAKSNPDWNRIVSASVNNNKRRGLP